MKKFLFIIIKIKFILFVNFNIFAGEFIFQSKEDFASLDKSNIKISKESAKKHILELSRKKQIQNRELFLDFETKNPNELKDKTGHYTVLQSNYTIVNKKTIYGKKHASFATSNSFVTVSTSNGRLLDSNYFTESFYISFFVLPGESEQYSSVFSKKYFTEGKKIGIECNIVNNKIEVNFSNMFQYTSSETKTFNLKSEDKLVTNEWTFVIISINPNTGKAFLYENGKLKSEIEAIKSTNNPTPLAFGFHKNDTTPLIIGKDFFGELDNFAIHKGEPEVTSMNEAYHSVEYDDINKFASQQNGTAYSKVLETKFSNSKLLSITTEMNKPEGTNLELYFRILDKNFEKNSNSIPWISSTDYEKFLDQKFKFFQWKLILRSNHDGTKTPSLEKIKFHYLDSIPPSMPVGLKILSSTNDSVCLKWTSNHEDNVRSGGSYLIHYGVSPNRMVGTISTNDSNEKITGIGEGLTLDKNYRNLSQCINNDLISKNALNRRDKNLLFFKPGLTYYFKITACNENYNSQTGFDQKSITSAPVSIVFKNE